MVPVATRDVSSYPALMRIVSLVPSATEMLFALGLGRDVTAVTHECDHPAEARDRPKVTRDVIGPGLPPAEIDRAVRELTEQGKAIYELDEDDARGAAARPDRHAGAVRRLRGLLRRRAEPSPSGSDPGPKVISLDPHTLGEVLGDVRTLAEATDARDAGVDLVAGRRRADRPRAAGRARRRAGPRGRAGVAGPDLRRRPLDAAADRVRGRPRRPGHARRALRAPQRGRRSPPPGPRSSS